MRTLLNDERWNVIRLEAARVAELPGSTAELGVWQGGTTRLIAESLPHKTHWAFDTWSGTPATTPIDIHRVGDFADCDFDEVSAWLVDLPNVNLVRGVFPASAVRLVEKFCLVHLDADTYRSTLDGLQWFYPRMTPGGVIILDDWEWPHCPGVKAAALEFFGGAERITPTVSMQAIIRIGNPT